MEFLLKVLKTEDQGVSLVLRMGLAIVIFPHGLQKISAFSDMIGILTNTYGLSSVIAVLVILIEFFAPLVLILGLATRLGSILIAIVMLGAIPFHWDNGFFMNWFGNQPGEGFQFHIIVIAAAIALALLGGGKWSLDYYLLGNLKRSL